MNSNSHWQFIAIVLRNYPHNPDYQDTQNFREFLEALQYVIPDTQYRHYYSLYLQKHSLDGALDNNHTIISWVGGMHPNLPLPTFEMNRSPAIIWEYISMICHSYPLLPSFQETMFYKQFFQSLGKVLPQVRFRNQYMLACRDIPIDPYLSSRENLIIWLGKIHGETPSVKPAQIIEGFDIDQTQLSIAVLILIAIVIYSRIR